MRQPMTAMPDADHELLQQYRMGDVAAMDRLVEQYRRPLYGYILNLTEGRRDADEIFQETWFRALRKLDSFKGGNFFGWLVRIARNYVIDRARRAGPDCSLDESLEDGQPRVERTAGGGLGPDGAAADADLGARIRAAVAGLPIEQREVFVMRTTLETPFKEIAEIQGVSINTALARMQYALAKLREGLQDDYGQLGRGACNGPRHAGTA